MTIGPIHEHVVRRLAPQHVRGARVTKGMLSTKNVSLHHPTGVWVRMPAVCRPGAGDRGVGQLPKQSFGQQRTCQQSSREDGVLRTRENSVIRMMEGRKGTGSSGITDHVGFLVGGPESIPQLVW